MTTPTTPRLHTSPRLPALALAILLACLALAGCGGSSDEVAQIQGSNAAVTKPMLDHWMRAMAGGDFRANVGTKGPLGLVSEPADYPACEAAARKIVPRAYTGKLKLSGAQIAKKCHELYRSIKAQAMSFLLSAQWAITEGKQLGLIVTDADLHKEFARFRKEIYPSEADLHKYLDERHWALSDVLYQLKRNILVSRRLPKFEAQVKQVGGGEAAYTRLALERYKSQVARTSCDPGYVAPGCREYHGPETVSPSPDAILEAFVQGLGG